MSEHFPSGRDQDPRQSAEALFGAINSAFEDWEGREIPPNGYEAQFSFDVSAPLIQKVQDDPDFSLYHLVAHNLRQPARWDVGIAVRPTLGRLGIVGLSMPLTIPGQRLSFRHDTLQDDVFNAYQTYQDRPKDSYRLATTDTSYIHELLAAVNIEVPNLNVPPTERTLALAQIANQAVVFEITQKKSIPVHPTQEIVLEKITSRSEPKEESQVRASRKMKDPVRGPSPKRFSYDTVLRATYTQVDKEGKPLYGQVVSFEGTDSLIAVPTIEIKTYRVHDMTGEVVEDTTEEVISAKLLDMIGEGLFTSEYGAEEPKDKFHE
jgi:hypothetical protein